MKKTFKPSTMLSPVPAIMVSCGDGVKMNLITIAWTGIVNSNPPMTYISVRPERYSYDLIKKSGEFVINLTTESLAFATDFCGVKSGRDVDKFETLNLTPEKGEVVHCPMIKESPVNLECKIVDVIPYPTHDMFVAEIVKVHVDKNLIDERGKIDFKKAKLISYIHGEYFGQRTVPLGRFGYSIMKPKTKKRISKENHRKRVEANRKKRRATKK